MTTRATPATPPASRSDAAPTPPLSPGRLPGYLLANTPGFFRHVWKEERHWLFLLIPLLFLTFHTYKMSLDKGGWTEFDSPLIYQPFVPLLAAVLVWSRRHQTQMLYEELAFMFPDDSPKRRGTVWLLLAGLLLLLVASVALISPLALLGLVVSIAGVVYYLHGPFMLRALWQPLLFLLLMVPPPTNLLAQFTRLLQFIGAFIAKMVFTPIFPGTKSQGALVLLGGNTPLVVTPTLAGMSVVVPLLVLTLFLCFLRRIRVITSVMILASALLIGVGLMLVRLLAFGFVSVNSPKSAEAMAQVNSWLLVALGFYLTYLVARRLTRVRRASYATGGDDEDDEDDEDEDD